MLLTLTVWSFSDSKLPRILCKFGLCVSGVVKTLLKCCDYISQSTKLFLLLLLFFFSVPEEIQKIQEIH